MPSLGPMEIILIILVIVILFGWNKLPDAARSLGRSMRIFKSEVEEMKKDKPSTASRETVPGTTVPPADAGTPPYQAPYQAPQQAPRPPHDSSAYQPQPGHPQAPPPSA